VFLIGLKVRLTFKKFGLKKKKNTCLVKKFKNIFKNPKSSKIAKMHFQQKLKNEASTKIYFFLLKSSISQAQSQTCS
jgi:hypothetical protein